MMSYPKIIALFFSFIAVAGATTLLALNNGQDVAGADRRQKKSPEMIAAESRLPVADVDAPEPKDAKEREKRVARGAKFEKSDLALDASADVVTSTTHWAEGLSDIPVGVSDVIVVGNVTDAKAYTNHGKTHVYSEFTIQVVDVIKDDVGSHIKVNNSIDVDRIGGRIRFPNGRVGQYFIVGQHMPEVGKQYLLFITKSDGKGDYNILTGYEIRDGIIHPLDNPGTGHPLTKREGSDATSFLNEVRAAVTNQ
jgi:hypothetical protein